MTYASLFVTLSPLPHNHWLLPGLTDLMYSASLASVGECLVMVSSSLCTHTSLFSRELYTHHCSVEIGNKTAVYTYTYHCSVETSTHHCSVEIGNKTTVSAHTHHCSVESGNKTTVYTQKHHCSIENSGQKHHCSTETGNKTKASNATPLLLFKLDYYNCLLTHKHTHILHTHPCAHMSTHPQTQLSNQPNLLTFFRPVCMYFTSVRETEKKHLKHSSFNVVIQVSLTGHSYITTTSYTQWPGANTHPPARSASHAEGNQPLPHVALRPQPSSMCATCTATHNTGRTQTPHPPAITTVKCTFHTLTGFTRIPQTKMNIDRLRCFCFRYHDHIGLKVQGH